MRLRFTRNLFAVLLSCFVLGSARTAAADLELTVPFEIRKGLIFLSVTPDNGAGPLRFIFDTGAAVSAIDSEVCSRLKIARRSTVAVAGLGGVVQAMWPVRFSGRVGNLPVPPKVLGLDLKALTAATGERIDGILGSDFLKDRILRIDFVSEEMIFSSSPFPHKTTAAVIPLKQKAGALLLPAVINNSKEKLFRLDTGCSSGLHWVDKESARRATSTVSVAGVADTKLGTMLVDATIGNGLSLPVEAMIHPNAIFPGEAGLIGNGILTNFVVTLDLKSSHVVLERYSYTAPLALAQ